MLTPSEGAGAWLNPRSLRPDRRRFRAGRSSDFLLNVDDRPPPPASPAPAPAPDLPFRLGAPPSAAQALGPASSGTGTLPSRSVILGGSLPTRQTRLTALPSPRPHGSKFLLRRGKYPARYCNVLTLPEPTANLPPPPSPLPLAVCLLRFPAYACAPLKPTKPKCPACLALSRIGRSCASRAKSNFAGCAGGGACHSPAGSRNSPGPVSDAAREGDPPVRLHHTQRFSELARVLLADGALGSRRAGREDVPSSKPVPRPLVNSRRSPKKPQNL